MIERIRRFDIVLLDLFSGIGGFTKGLEDAGFNIVKHYYSEIDKHAIANYRYNYEKAECVGSISDLGGGSITRPDIITFGSPCQDFSMAGKRTGIKGQRSSLIGQALRIIKECRPEFFIWENVKGVFSSNSGADFWAIIQAFANIGGYRLEWQLVNTAWVLPQNRERIYLIGHLAKAGRDFSGVFPFREVDFRNDELGKFNETANIRTLSAGGHSGGHHSAMTLIKEGNLNSSQDGNVFNTEGLSQSLSAGHGNVPKIIIPSNTKQGYEIAEEGDSVNLQQPNSTSRRGRVGHGIAQTLETQSFQIVIVGNLKGEDGHNVHNVVSDQGISPTVRSNHGKVQPGQVAPEFITDGVDDDGFEIGHFATPMRWSRTEKGKESRRKNQKEGKDNTPFNDGNRELIPSDDKVCGCVTSALNKDALIGVNNSNIRRLTEIECERLQGFPDNWTEYGNYNGIVKKIPKTQRYKLLGNAVTVKIVEEIGKRLRINYY